MRWGRPAVWDIVVPRAAESPPAALPITTTGGGGGLLRAGDSRAPDGEGGKFQEKLKGKNPEWIFRRKWWGGVVIIYEVRGGVYVHE
jgi:hypothetical protein